MMRYLKGLAVMAGMLAASLGSAQLEPLEGKFKVVDEAGKPVADAQVQAMMTVSMIRFLSYPGKTDEEGTIVLEPSRFNFPEQMLKQINLEGGKIAVVKKGYGPTIFELSQTEDGEWEAATVTLTKDRPYILNINAPEDADLSKLDIKLIPASLEKDAMRGIPQSNGVFTLKDGKDGVYQGMFGSISEDVIVFMKLEGFNDFQTETITAEQVMQSDGSEITINLTKGIPVEITSAPEKPEMAEILKDNRVNLNVMAFPNKQVGHFVKSESSSEGELVTLKAMLPPGDYRASLNAGNFGIPNGMIANESLKFTVSATDESVSKEMVLNLVTPESLDGDEKIAVTLKTSGGDPAKGLPYRLTFRQGMQPPTEVRSGVVPDDGVLKIDGIAATDYGLEVNGIRVSSKFTVASKGKDAAQAFDFTVPPGEGDPMIDLNLIDMETGEGVKLSDYKGKVVFLDFWATWCGPCQVPMAHNSEVVARRSDWEGKAAVVALSIDDTMDVLEKHVADKGWGNLDHVYAEEGGTGWNSKARHEYGVSGIPTCFLIDQKGTIVWRGHPSSFNLEEEIDKLLAANSGE